MTRYFGSEGLRASLKVLDPLEYKDRYADNTVTYVVNAANDEFFALTGPLSYWDKLNGKKLLRILPDQPHGGAWGGWDRDDENTVSSKNKSLYFYLNFSRNNEDENCRHFKHGGNPARQTVDFPGSSLQRSSMGARLDPDN